MFAHRPLSLWGDGQKFISLRWISCRKVFWCWLLVLRMKCAPRGMGQWACTRWRTTNNASQNKRNAPQSITDKICILRFNPKQCYSEGGAHGGPGTTLASVRINKKSLKCYSHRIFIFYIPLNPVRRANVCAKWLKKKEKTTDEWINTPLWLEYEYEIASLLAWQRQ